LKNILKSLSLAVSEVLIDWYHTNKRDLPWRRTKNPYNIWLSEIILQQTRVEQGLPYYNNFIEEYPDVKSLALAPEDDILKLWQGLGYYSRARNMHKTAQIIVNQYNGVFPDNFKELLKLKGVGEYTASAIASFSFNEPTAVVDGNVYRFLARYFGIGAPIPSLKSKNIFTGIANELICKKKPDEFNQAIMEFGALQCTPHNPNCESCPFSTSCFAFQNKKTKELPVKEKKSSKKERYLYYFFLNNNNYTFLQKRTKNDIWKNLYEFPLLELSVGSTEEEVLNSPYVKNLAGENFKLTAPPSVFTHNLTHQKIIATFFTININDFIKNTTPLIQISLNDLNKYAISRLTDKFLKKINNK
jgi:A/G-specific adenine glycosylase